jgi:polyhydroxyalkanoate synthase
MSGAFQLLRSNDLIWSQRITEYLLGERPPMSDLMAWNADGTRLPYRMHSEYLRRLYLHNDLSAGRYQVDGRSVALRDIRVPIFAVGTVKDHVAPWRSVYKINLLTDSDVTFLLTSGGHNAGIVSEPNHASRSYQVATRTHDEPHLDPEAWARQAPRSQGSWWPEWQRWLERRSGARVAPPEFGNAAAGYPVLDEAPGGYVHQK